MCGRLLTTGELSLQWVRRVRILPGNPIYLKFQEKSGLRNTRKIVLNIDL